MLQRMSRASALRRPPPVLVLAVPFLIAIAVLHGLTVQIRTFHYTDEHAYHLPTITEFARSWPFPDLTRYPAAQTPLYHWTMAGVVKALGFHVWILRLLSAAFSYGAAVVLFRLLVRRGLREWSACALALLFALSPYVFGTSFLAMTDGLALLLILLALARLDAFHSSSRPFDFVVFLLWLALAVLTRQSALWLAAAGICLVALDTRSMRSIGLACAGTALAVAPFAALVLAWDGLVPRGSDPTSCGLCRAGDAATTVTLRPGLFTLAIVGIYAASVLGPSLVAVPPRARSLWPAILAAAASLLLLAVEPLQRTGERDAGYLWRVASHLPDAANASLIFWLLVPIGALLGVYLATRALPDPFIAVLAAAFLLSTLVVRLPYQKYFDPFALLFVMLAVDASRDLGRPWRWLGVIVLGLAFVTYTITF